MWFICDICGFELYTDKRWYENYWKVAIEAGWKLFKRSNRLTGYIEDPNGKDLCPKCAEKERNGTLSQ